MAVEYIIQRGDNLSKIARRHAMTWPQLYEYTGDTDRPNSDRLRSGDPDLIFPGEVILVPGTDESDPEPSENREAGVIAMIEEHRVRTGETLESVARANGMSVRDLARFNWGTEHPSEINRRLREEVGSTNTSPDGRTIIFDDSDEPGVLFIPRPWTQSGLETGTEHVIRVRHMPPGERRLIITLLDAGENPRPGVPYRLEVGDRVFEKETDAQGRVDHVIPVGATEGTLTVDGLTYPLGINELPSIEQSVGVRERLKNLGYLIESNAEDGDSSIRRAVAAFQDAHEDLLTTGDVDEATRTRLKQVYGH